MPRVKGSTIHRARRKKVLDEAKGYFGSKHRLYKTAKEYNCDIDGFGKYAVKYFPTIKDWQDYNWLDNFQNSTFNVNVETTIKSGNTFL